MRGGIWRGLLTAVLLLIAPRIAPAAEEDGYRIGPDDLLQISVWKNETMSVTVPVRPDGRISLPLLHDVPAAGLTPMQLRDRLTERMSEYMPRPEISVIVQEVRSRNISVLGEVAHPGRYPLKSPTTVLDALASAGGLTEFAARTRIVILREGGGKAERIRFDFKRAAAGKAASNPELLPGDIVLVP